MAEMTEIIKSIYKKKSYGKLKLILEFLYAQHERSENEYISVSDLARKRKIKKDVSNTRKVLIKMGKEGIIDVKCLGDARNKKLYKLSKEAYNIIKRIKTAS